MIVKILTAWHTYPEGGLFPPVLEWQGTTFITDPACDKYDWLVVYDELPRSRKKEPLACPSSHTILITQEPQSIKIYNPSYTSQFEYVLTTQDQRHLEHRNFRLGRGCYIWFNGRTAEENAAAPEFEKNKVVSAICSTKNMKHTAHHLRYKFISQLSRNLPQLDWFGWGKKAIKKKHEALDDYKYTIPMENHIQEHHWSEKLADAFLSLCLPFYAGDPAIGECFPEESYIPIPLDDPIKAQAIIQKAIADGEYEKRLPAIRQARRLILEKYNIWSQIISVISDHQERYRHCPEPNKPRSFVLERHYLRLNPIHMIAGAWYQLKLFFRN